ncbi:MAG: hypothetical protein M1549_03280 [Candidatus Dependentiae bacterium]|nr:hypothetical protein [Candidatus Dependentiae bacterium]
MARTKKDGWLTWGLAFIFLLIDLLCSRLLFGMRWHHQLAFSLRHAVSPLIGVWGGLLSVCILFVTKGLIHACAAWGSRLMLVWHLPTLCGTLYLTLLGRDRRWVRALAAVPALVCMFLFWLHPVGRQAPLYPLYWLIPIAIALSTWKNFFLHALGSTFCAHAVGSTLWLYGGLLASPTAWNALIPVVAFERFGFACLMTTVFLAVTALVSLGRAVHTKYRSHQPIPLLNSQKQ